MPLGRIRPRHRARGVTLVELLVALALLGILGALVGRMLVRGERRTAEQVERVGVQTALRASLVVLLSELRELGRDGQTGPDLVRLAPDSLTYRAPRGLGLTCAVAPGEIRLASASFTGLRALAVGRDSLLLFVEGDSTRADDDRWAAAPVLRVGAGTCGTTPAIVVETALGGLDPGALVVGGPVRSFEIMQLKRYVQGGQHWLGARSVSAGESVQPVVGPLAPDGLRFRFLEAGGAETWDAHRVRLIEVTVAALSARPVIPAGGGAAAALRDTLVVAVALRNAAVGGP